MRHPDWFDVVVASNLFGDILSDLGPACTGTIGIAPSANINPERTHPSLFEPVHGSAPDIAQKGIANPIGQIWCGAMMMEHLGHPEAGAAILKAIEKVLAAGPAGAPFTPDIGGRPKRWISAKRSPTRWNIERVGVTATTCFTRSSIGGASGRIPRPPCAHAAAGFAVHRFAPTPVFGIE